MRHLSILILAVACAGSSGTRLPSPIDSDERNLLGCYRVVFVGQEHGAPFRWGSTWAPAEVTLQLDSTPAWRFHDYIGHTATFIEGMPADPDVDLKRAPTGWRRSADTVY